MLIFHDPEFVSCVSKDPAHGGPDAWEACRQSWCEVHVHDNHASIEYCFSSPVAVGDDVDGVIVGSSSS
jgi:hypothetical protein